MDRGFDLSLAAFFEAGAAQRGQLPWFRIKHLRLEVRHLRHLVYPLASSTRKRPKHHPSASAQSIIQVQAPKAAGPVTGPCLAAVCPCLFGSLPQPEAVPAPWSCSRQPAPAILDEATTLQPPAASPGTQAPAPAAAACASPQNMCRVCVSHSVHARVSFVHVCVPMGSCGLPCGRACWPFTGCTCMWPPPLPWWRMCAAQSSACLLRHDQGCALCRCGACTPLLSWACTPLLGLRRALSWACTPRPTSASLPRTSPTST